MTPEQITAIAGGLVLVMGAYGALVVKLNGIHKLVNDKYEKSLSVIADQAVAIAKLTNTQGDRALAKKAIEEARPKERD